MASLSRFGWTVICLLLLWTKPVAQSEGAPCSTPVGAPHPVQGLLERFKAGPGCAAREHGNKETHVIAVGRSTNSPGNKVTVLLKPLSPSPSPPRVLHLLLSSKQPISWWLEAERLPPSFPVLVQVASNSSVESHSLRPHVQTLRFLPFRPRALLRWALKHHGSLSSLTHTAHGNHVHVRLGEDATLPAVCQLQSMFLSHNYMTSDLQPQEMQGCVLAPAGGIGPEVHVIKLHSAGSGLCGSLQVEVIVSLVLPAFGPKGQNVVLILSSSVPVNWAIVARGVRGHISVYSSNSVSPPYPPEPNLTLSSTVDLDLSTILDLRVWANKNGFTTVTSYTEADLANRFVVQLSGGGTDVAAVVKPLVPRPPWAEERRVRQWLNGGGRESFTVQCEDGLLNVTVDQHILQGWPVPVAAVTLQDPTCQAQTNGSHFLLVFPVISCGTEAVLLGRPRGVQYKNMVLLWRDQPQSILALSETEKKSRSPLSIQFSCWMAVPSPPGPAADNIDEANPVQVGLVPWGPEVPNPNPEFHQSPAHRQGSRPILHLKLFVTEDYEQRRIGPCVVTADHRIYAEISAKGPLTDVVEVKSCVVSPLSDPKKSPFWSVMSEGCSSDPSLTLTARKNNEEAEGEGDLEEQREEKEEDDVQRRHKPEVAAVEEDQVQRLRFSFILRPVYNDSMQFLHCSLQLCGSDSTRGKPMKEPETKDCQDGQRIPPLVFKSPKHQCEIRNLSRPMVVTRSITSLAPKVPRPPAGPRTKRLSVSPQIGPNPDSSFVLEMGPVMGIVFAAFVMGIGLMGGLWCIYSHTGGRPASLGGDQSHLTDQTHGGHNIWSPSPQSDPSSSSV